MCIGLLLGMQSQFIQGESILESATVESELAETVVESETAEIAENVETTAQENVDQDVVLQEEPSETNDIISEPKKTILSRNIDN